MQDRSNVVESITLWTVSRCVKKEKNNKIKIKYQAQKGENILKKKGNKTKKDDLKKKAKGTFVVHIHSVHYKLFVFIIIVIIIIATIIIITITIIATDMCIYVYMYSSVYIHIDTYYAFYTCFASRGVPLFVAQLFSLFPPNPFAVPEPKIVLVSS